jgi:hypothetical protein
MYRENMIINAKLVNKVTEFLPYFLLAEWMVASPGVSSHSLFSSIAASTRLAAKIRRVVLAKNRDTESFLLS